MELKIAQVEIPKIIEFNYEELKNEISAKAHDYEVMVYTEDKIKEAKADKAALNKLKKALNDERIKQEKEYMKPFNEFKDRVNEIIKIIDAPIGIIDSQIKEFDAKKAEEKKNEIQSFWISIDKPSFLKLEQIWNARWMNATFKMKDIEAEITGKIETIKSDLETLKNLNEYSFEATETYQRTLDLGASIAEGQRLQAIQKAKEEAESRRAEEEARRAQEEAEKPTIDTTAQEIPYEKPEVIPEPPKADKEVEQAQWIGFEALLTVEKALKLKQFFADNNITFRRK